MCGREKQGKSTGRRKEAGRMLRVRERGGLVFIRYEPNRIRTEDETDVRGLCNRIIHIDNV